MSTPAAAPRITTLYRSLLRELPIRQTPTATSKPTRLNSPSKLQQRIRAQLSAPETTTTSQLQLFEQFVRYTQAQRQYVTLVERYNPGMGMSEEERVRLTARRVGMELPKMAE